MPIDKFDIEEEGRRLQLDFDANMAQIKHDIAQQMKAQNVMIGCILGALLVFVAYQLYLYFTV